jgi:hypothetical protein
MKYYLKQQFNPIAKSLKAPFTWVGHPLLIFVAMIGLVLVCAGCLESTEQQGPKVNQTTNTNQTTISTHTPLSFALTPSITPSRSSSTNSKQLPAAETFTGNGVKKTTSFTAPKSWKIVWSCDLSSHNNTSYDIIIHANTINNMLLANSVETTCNTNNTHGFITMNQAGKVYLVIISEGSWAVQVQY